MAARSEKVTFTGGAGETLAARLDLPEGAPRAYALFAHCFTCSKDVFAAARVAGGLTAHGIAVLRFDFTGLGASEGEFANTNFTSNVADLVAAAAFLGENYSAAQILIGHSLGGAAVLAAAARIPQAAAVVTINAPHDPSHVAGHFHAAMDEINAEGAAEVSLGGRPFTIKKQFLDDISAQHLDEAIANLDRALLVFHGPRDEIVGIDNAQQIFQAAKHPKSFISLDDADHLLHRKEDAFYVADVIAAWSDRYISADKKDQSAQDFSHYPQAGAGEIVVTESGQGTYTQAVSIGGRHWITADEPEDAGGNDLGPSPYDLLLAGLGACTAMTLRMYAARKKWPLTRVSVRLSHKKIHAEDCAECETRSGKIDNIDREIEITGDLDRESRERLLEIADKCPVHRTLHSEIREVTHEKA